VEKTGLVTGSGYGHPHDEGPGRGYSTQYEGSGGAHASQGTQQLCYFVKIYVNQDVLILFPFDLAFQIKKC
jgi:hypothetical protein